MDTTIDWAARDAAWAGVRDERVAVRGHEVRVLRTGTPGSGSPQLLVHGLGGAAPNWLDVLVPLAVHGEVLAVDLPGFGATRLPAGGSARIRANVGFLGALLDELGWDDVTVFGNSMGGLLATLLAGREPVRVRRLVLVNPALPTPRKHLWRMPKRVLLRILPAAIPGVGRALIELGFRQRSAEDLVDESLMGILGEAGEVRPSFRTALVDNVQLARTEGWRRRALADAARSMVVTLADAREVNAAIDSLHARTLLLWGDADLLVSTHVITGLIERRPDWDHHVFGGAGHAPQIEVPDAFVDVVSDWYRQGPDPSAVGTG